MSLVADGRRIVCNGDNCSEETSVPVALPQLAAGSARSKQNPAENWLYVRINGVWKHYCPRCAIRYHQAHTDGLEPITPDT